VTLELEVKGVERLDEILQRLPLKMRERVDARLGEGAEATAEKAREIAPVRTGYLRSTITSIRTSLLSWRVQAAAPYAKFVEYGTSRVAAKPYLRPALILTRPLVTSLIRMGLIEAIQERSK